MQFAHPGYLWLLLILIPIIVWYVFKHRESHPALHISSTLPFSKVGLSYKEYLLHVLFVLRLFTISCVIVVLARPQTHDSWNTTNTEGIDIIITSFLLLTFLQVCLPEILLRTDLRLLKK